MASTDANISIESKNLAADRSLFHEQRGGKLQCLIVQEIVVYPPAANLTDVIGPETSIPGAVRQLASAGPFIRQAVVVGDQPNLYMSPVR